MLDSTFGLLPCYLLYILVLVLGVLCVRVLNLPPPPQPLLDTIIISHARGAEQTQARSKITLPRELNSGKMGFEPKASLVSKSMRFSYCYPVSCAESGLVRVGDCLPGLLGRLSGFTCPLETISNSTSSNCPALDSTLQGHEDKAILLLPWVQHCH